MTSAAVTVLRKARLSFERPPANRRRPFLLVLARQRCNAAAEAG